MSKRTVELVECDYCNRAIIGQQSVRAMLGNGKNIEFTDGAFFVSVGQDDKREYRDLCSECMTDVIEHAVFGGRS